MRDEIISLETRVAYQEKMIDELNKIVYRQQVQIDFLVEKFPEILDRLKSLGSGQNLRAAQDDAPPHY